MVLDFPTTLAVDILAIATYHLVADNVKVVTGLVAEKLLQQRTNNGPHPRRQNDNGHIVVTSPVVELLEVWVQFHVLQECCDTFVVGSLDATKHFTESVTNIRGQQKPS